jgi:hypothetical protein
LFLLKDCRSRVLQSFLLNLVKPQQTLQTYPKQVIAVYWLIFSC